MSWIEAHSGLAAWLQGAGTLIALGLTVWAVLHESGRAERLRRADLRHWVETIEGLTFDLTSLVAGHRNEARVPTTATRGDVDEYRMILVKLLQTPLMQWPSSRLQTRVWRLERDLVELIDLAKKYTAANARRADKENQARYAREYISLQSGLASTADLVLAETLEIRRAARIGGGAWPVEDGSLHNRFWRYKVKAPED